MSTRFRLRQVMMTRVRVMNPGEAPPTHRSNPSQPPTHNLKPTPNAPPPPVKEIPKPRYSKSGLKESEVQWHRENFPDDPDSSGSSMEDDVQEFNFSPQCLTPKYLNSTSAFDIPLVFKASPTSPALNARHHTLTIPHGCSSRDLYDAGFRLFRAVPMRMPRKWSHTGDIPLTPSMAKYLCAVPRTSGVFETRFKE